MKKNKKKQLHIIETEYKIMTNPKLLSIKEFKKEEYKIKVANDNKKIRILYTISGNEITELKKTVNINTKSIPDLYDIIKHETCKLNIATIMINDYLYTHSDYTETFSSIVKISNKSIQPENTLLYILLNKNYNEDYIEVSLTFGSYVPYIKNIILWDYIYIQKKNNYKSIFIDSLSKLDNNCISSDNYNKIESFIVNKIELELQYFLLNEIKKYLTIN